MEKLTNKGLFILAAENCRKVPNKESADGSLGIIIGAMMVRDALPFEQALENAKALRDKLYPTWISGSLK